jgi:hypothetical protein
MGDTGRGEDKSREEVHDANHGRKEGMDGVVVWKRRRRMKW